MSSDANAEQGPVLGENPPVKRYEFEHPQNRLDVDETSCGQCSWRVAGDHPDAWHDHQKAEHPERYERLMALVYGLGSIGGSWDLAYEGAAMRLAAWLLMVEDNLAPSANGGER